MKNYIFKGCLFFLFIIIGTSCSKDLDDKTSLYGTWIETAPVPGRTTLYFAQGNKLTRIDADGNTENYNYRIKDNTLFLSLTGDLEGSAEIFFDEINPNKIKTGNLYASIPEAEPVFLIFERE